MSLEGGPAPGARSWPTEEGGRESLLIYLLPWHSPWVGAPPRAGTDGVPGSQQYLSSLGHPPGEMHLSPTQEATRGGIWRSRDPRGLRGLKEPGSRFCVSECRLLCLRHCSCLHIHIPSLPRSTGLILSTRPPWISSPLFSSLWSLSASPVFGSCCLLCLKSLVWGWPSSVLPTTLHPSQRMVIISFALWEGPALGLGLWLPSV